MNIKKGTPQYHAGFEISDLCANPLRKVFENPGKRILELAVFKDKILLNKELTYSDFMHTFGHLKDYKKTS